MIRQHFIIGTAGHIDHGKSSLVKALTGIDPDRLPEEKARGMTIDLGFAHLNLTDPANLDREFQIGIVDVPGHADFVKNMVAGVGSIDLALLVIAADDGWMPQTEEHLQILSYLGVTKAVIALTKSDIADVDFATGMIREALQGTAFATAPLVPVAAPLGRGIPELKRALATALHDLPIPANIGRPRLAVDRVFSPAGIGTVVTGTLTGGVLQKNQAVIIQSPGISTHLRNLQSHGKNVATAAPGTRTALQLADVTIDGRSAKRGVRRGDVITVSALGGPSSALHVFLERSSRNLFASKAADRPLRHGQKILWHHGTAAHEALLRLLGAKTLAPGDACLAELIFTEPVFAFACDRFILRDLARQATVAGGVVLDPDAAGGTLRKKAVQEFLQRRAAASQDLATLILTGIERAGAVLRDGFLAKSRFADSEILTAVSVMAGEGKILTAGPWFLDAAWWKRQIAAAGATLKAHHQDHPEALGMDVAEFSNVMASKLPDRRLMDVLINALAASGFVRAGKTLRTAAHRPNLPPHLASAGDSIRAALAANPNEPPNLGELTPTPAHKQALTFLLETGEAVKLDDKTVISAESLTKLRAAIIAHLRKTGSATASDLRQATGTTRRILIPLLEKFDREGITLRKGDLRSVGRLAIG